MANFLSHPERTLLKTQRDNAEESDKEENVDDVNDCMAVFSKARTARVAFLVVQDQRVALHQSRRW